MEGLIRRLLGRVEKDRLRGKTVLIVRHAEKPAKGRDLSAAGWARAEAYAAYFMPFRWNGVAYPVTALFAGAD